VCVGDINTVIIENLSQVMIVFFMDLPSLVKGNLSLESLVFVSDFTIFHMVLDLFLECIIGLLK